MKHDESQKLMDNSEHSDIFFNFSFNVYFLRKGERERERQSMSGGEAEREGDTESEAGSRL